MVDHDLGYLDYALFVPLGRGSGCTAVVKTLLKAWSEQSDCVPVNVVQTSTGRIELDLETKAATMLAPWQKGAHVCDMCLAVCMSRYIDSRDDQSLLVGVELISHLRPISVPTLPTQLQHTYSCKRRGMCYTEHVYHQCAHWGRERIVGEPCCRARIVDSRSTPCLYTENIGSVNSNELCSQCSYHKARGDAWRPFAHVSNAGWARVEEKLEQRVLRLSSPALAIEGTFAPSCVVCHAYKLTSPA
ncbi:uncharacterized protein EKO05_0005690 [Ascochyta rabiei]|uniref:uncharacterized protein n=1 Tax=Didymella rabiei TaxID=5454 RepID=UPI00220D2B4A|nr:uncharacterized protein EKO05_0005690 [Ascochyta rabiei]UPX15234.1 hypothetical protein EKO05_0005690 [Ascochyta rabiei]